MGLVLDRVGYSQYCITLYTTALCALLLLVHLLCQLSWGCLSTIVSERISKVLCLSSPHELTQGIFYLRLLLCPLCDDLLSTLITLEEL